MILTLNMLNGFFFLESRSIFTLMLYFYFFYGGACQNTAQLVKILSDTTHQNF